MDEMPELGERLRKLEAANADLVDRVAWLEGLAATADGMMASVLADVRSTVAELRPHLR